MMMSLLIPLLQRSVRRWEHGVLVSLEADRKGGRHMPGCLRWHVERIERCDEFRDDGYLTCARQERRCKSFLPSFLGFVCGLFGLVCVAWTWIANVVCA